MLSVTSSVTTLSADELGQTAPLERRFLVRYRRASVTFTSLDHNLPKISRVQHINYPEKGQ